MAANPFGNVQVNVNSLGDLVLTGDNNQHDVEITQSLQNGNPIAGRYFITPHQGTTLNGHTTGLFVNNVTHDIRVSLGGNNDRLNLHAGNGNDFGFRVPNDLNINLGNGNNVLNIDHIAVGDDASIFSGGGADSVFFRGTVGFLGTVDGGANDLTIDTGDRNDNITLQNFAVKRDVSVRTGTDAFTDSVDMLFASIGRNTNVSTGAGSDRVTVNEVGFNGTAQFDTGADGDTVSITASQADQFFFNLGLGDDIMTMTNSFGRRATLNGGTNTGDNDSLTESGNQFTELFSVVNFEHHNH
jgi:hypothetical protein